MFTNDTVLNFSLHLAQYSLQCPDYPSHLSIRFAADDRPGRRASVRTSANIDPSLARVTRHEDQESKETGDGPKAVRAREEIGTVVVQLCLIDGETPTDSRARARNPSRRSNAISLGASYSRCLSAGTRVSLSAIPRRGDRGESASEQKPAGVLRRR